MDLSLFNSFFFLLSSIVCLLDGIMSILRTRLIFIFTDSNLIYSHFQIFGGMCISISYALYNTYFVRGVFFISFLCDCVDVCVCFFWNCNSCSECHCITQCLLRFFRVRKLFQLWFLMHALKRKTE